MNSLLAGASTCLGAAVVWVQRDMEPYLPFSLALAGSVMTTVSSVSILPETLASGSFGERLAAFAGGCTVYYIISKFALPEPDQLLTLQQHSNDKEVDEVQQRSFIVTDDDNEALSPPSAHRFRRNRSSDMSPPIASSSDDTIYNKHEKGWAWKTFSSGSDLTTDSAKRAWRLSLLLFLSLLIHNFPEVRTYRDLGE